MATFPKFIKKHSPLDQHQPVPAKTIAEYEKSLPESLLKAWKEYGWRGFGEGFFWLVNPADFAPILSDWLAKPKSYTVFARTGFGDMFVWDKAGAHCLHVHTGEMLPLVAKFDLFMEFMMCDKEYLDEAHDYPLFKKAVKKLGVVSSEQMYSFNPALALGGAPKLDNVVKVKLREHLALLIQNFDKIKG